MKPSRANLQPRATMSSSTSVSLASSTGAMRASAHKSRKALLVLCSLSSDEGVVAASPHGEASERLKLNFTPRRPLRVPACASTALVAGVFFSFSGV